MELQLILQRLKDTIDKMETLSDSQFDYIDIISEFDFQKGCGTVCCVYGWYPNWFANEGFRYNVPSQDSMLHEIAIFREIDGKKYHGLLNNLNNYHGLSTCILETLFCGEPLFGQNEMLVENDIENDLDTVIRVFKRVYELLENGTIAPDYDDTDYYFD